MVVFFVAIIWFAASSLLAGDDFSSRIATIESKTGSRVGVSAFDTETGKHLEYRADERFQMCSTFKFLAIAAVLQRVDQKQECLDRFVVYDQADILEYAPVTKDHLKDGGMTLDALCAAALAQSDNTAANLILDLIDGPDGVTKFARRLGDKVTRLDRKEPELNVPTKDGQDTTSPAAMQADMVLLLNGELLSSTARTQLETWLVENETGRSMIRASAPPGSKVGDKTGRGANGATNDIAIVRPPNRKPVVLAIYTTGSSAPADRRDAIVAETARIVFEVLSVSH